MVRLENLGKHGPVIVAEAAEQHVTVPAMAAPKMSRHVSPLVRAHLTTRLLAAEPTNLLLVATQVIVKLLLLFEKEGTILERARQLSLFMIRLQFVRLQFLGRFSFQHWFLQTGRRWWWWVNTWYRPLRKDGDDVPSSHRGVLVEHILADDDAEV